MTPDRAARLRSSVGQVPLSIEYLLVTLATTIAEIESNPLGGGEAFIPGRYPYTYGWDYARSHASEIGWLDDSTLSRSSVSRFFHDAFGDDDVVTAATMLADAYLREHHITKPVEEPK